MITQGAQASGIFRPDMDNKETLGKSPAVVAINGGYGIEYQGCEFSNCGIWQRAINGTNPVQITDQPSDQGLSASADGASVAFMSYDRDGASDWEVYVMAADGTNLKRLTNRPGVDGIPTWSTDGESGLLSSENATPAVINGISWPSVPTGPERPNSLNSVF